MLSINTALQVDLFAQANASYVHEHIYSGFGGQLRTRRGRPPFEGRPCRGLSASWHEKTDASTVVPILSVPACSSQHSVVVSEHGSAEIFGRPAASLRLIEPRRRSPRPGRP